MFKKVSINKRYYNLYNDFVSSNDGMILSKKNFVDPGVPLDGFQI